MFSPLGLFGSIKCPDGSQCTSIHCLFSHREGATRDQIPDIPITVPKRVSTPQRPANPAAAAPKRGIASTSTPPPINGNAIASGSGSLEPPSKLQKLDSVLKRPAQRSPQTSSYTSMGVPVLTVNAAHSKVPVPVRQAMLKTLYEHFAQLYSEILVQNPTLASDHALSQELDVYESSTKQTYRNAVISSVATLKKRAKPTSLSHDSVGTVADLKRRQENRRSIHALHLTKEHIKSYILSRNEMIKYGYVVDIPEGAGGSSPSEEGKVKECERCRKQFMVKRMSEASECTFHWGKPYTMRLNGERTRIYKCCSMPVNDSEGCSRGPHVFSETDPAALHIRHAFSATKPSDPDDGMSTALDVVAIDCEMIYSTAGVSVARVSVVDGSGKQIFDELVRMDEGVEVIDYNTRFSGITEETHGKAVLTLNSVRRSLDALINTDTVIIGHSLESDLKTLRMIHHTCVDTVALFPHRNGFPYRRALRDLVREYLNEIIQAGGGTVGHSSVEDAIGTLNLVRWFVLNKAKAQSSNLSGYLAVL